MATTNKSGTLYTTDGTNRTNWYPVTLAGNVQTQGGSDVETELSGKYELPSGGIPVTDLASSVQTSLGKADTALQSAPVASVNNKTGAVVLSASDVGAGTYSKPSGGIPSSDLAQSVQDSLDLADTALQSAPVSSVNGRTGAVTGLQEELTVVSKTASDTSQTLAEDTFYIWPTMSSLTITCPATGGPYAFRFGSGSTATTLTMTGITMPDNFSVEANKIYEINVFEGYGVAVSWGAAS